MRSAGNIKNCEYFLCLLEKARDPDQAVDMDFLLFHLNTCMDCHAELVYGRREVSARVRSGEERWSYGRDKEGKPWRLARHRTLVEFF